MTRPETPKVGAVPDEVVPGGVASDRHQSDQWVDVFELIRLRRSLQGETPLAELGRLLEGLPEQVPKAVVRWQVAGEHGAQGEALIHLGVAAHVTLQCERCLGPLLWPIDSTVSLQVVQTEAELDDPDTFEWADLEQEGYDKVLGSKKFDLIEQVQDELILSMPYVPKHETCPASPVTDVLENPSAGPSPFDILSSIKKDEQS